jgi:signal transduction histidine kinase
LSPEHEQFELLELIDREIVRISGITHQMYQLYRRAPQSAVEFQIEQVVAEVAHLLENVARKRRVSLTLVPSHSATRVMLPEGEVKQILYNLVRNAIQASPPNQEVTLRCTHSADEVAIEVKDRGPGIPHDVLPRIFDPFFSTKQGESESGMGLGLSVSRSLIDAMGGRIEVASEANRGSAFTAVFPRRLEPPPEAGHD